MIWIESRLQIYLNRKIADLVVTFQVSAEHCAVISSLASSHYFLFLTENYLTETPVTNTFDLYSIYFPPKISEGVFQIKYFANNVIKKEDRFKNQTT